MGNCHARCEPGESGENCKTSSDRYLSVLNPMNMEDAKVTDTNSASSVQRMRTACHNILYTVVNSRAYNEENTKYEMVLWKKILFGADIFAAVILLMLEMLAIRKYRKNEEAIKVEVRK